MHIIYESNCTFNDHVILSKDIILVQTERTTIPRERTKQPWY